MLDLTPAPSLSPIRKNPWVDILFTNYYSRGTNL